MNSPETVNSRWVDISKYRNKTNNKYFPNTEKDWNAFLLKVYFSGMDGYMLCYEYDRLEKLEEAD